MQLLPCPQNEACSNHCRYVTNPNEYSASLQRDWLEPVARHNTAKISRGVKSCIVSGVQEPGQKKICQRSRDSLSLRDVVFQCQTKPTEMGFDGDASISGTVVSSLRPQVPSTGYM